MLQLKTYRDRGAVGALLDEYEKAILEVKTVIRPLSATDLTTIVDPHTKDPDCVSIQSILGHVVRAGYNYVIEVRNAQGEKHQPRTTKTNPSVQDYLDDLNIMFDYNVQLFEDYPNLRLEESDITKKMKVSWGQTYDVEQLFEHAIVHVLRHRRQIERFILKLRA